MSQPTKRLVVLYDGTDNTPKDNTNVWKTHQLLAASDAAGVPQEKVYIEGVGTEIGSIVAGSIFGSGVAAKIRQGYKWLVMNYEEGAEIYVFGFSRGAFTARSLVQMIANCGITCRGSYGEWKSEQAFDRYESISRQDKEVLHPIWRLRYWRDNPDKAPAGWVPTADDRRLMDESQVQYVKVRMAGLWDTVGAMGPDALKNHGASTQKSAAHNVRPTSRLEFSYHAMAIDEHRPMFQNTLWRTFVEAGHELSKAEEFSKTYEQRWFVGAHSDVGGGYKDDPLPDISMNWMQAKAASLGLAFTSMVVPSEDAWSHKPTDSYSRFAGGVLSIWDTVVPGDQRFYREIGRAPRPVRTGEGKEGFLISLNETIDETVYRKWSEDPTYRPPSLVDYFRRHPAKEPSGNSGGAS